MLTNQLNEILDGLGLLTYELVLAAGALLVLIIGVLSKKIWLSKVAFTLTLLVSLWWMPSISDTIQLFDGSLVLDGLGVVMKWLFSLLAIWIVFFPNSRSHPPEFYFLILSILLGSSLMLSANHLLVVYLVVELTSFSAYILTNFNFKKQSFEAGMKYLIFGGISSALALYGASLIYGFTGTLSFGLMDFELMAQPALLNVGIILFIGAILFKVSVVPFHIWVPATYQESPTDAVLILSVIPKIAGFVLLHRVISLVQIQDTYWLYVLMAVLGSVTVVFGALGAIRQTNLKRLIAYGAISHSGYLLAALLVPFEEGVTAFVWYAIIYAIMNLAIFYFISVWEVNGRKELSDLSGMYISEILLSVLVIIPIIALIGLPPTAGFTAKFYLFTILWNWYQEISDVAILSYLIVLILTVVVSLFLYLKIPFYIFLKEATAPKIDKSKTSQKILATIFSLALLWVFLRPEILNKIAEQINSINW